MFQEGPTVCFVEVSRRARVVEPYYTAERLHSLTQIAVKTALSKI